MQPVSSTEGVDLFPMMNVFLCVFGVLAFLTVLAAGVRSTLEARTAKPLSESSAVLQALCYPDGVVFIPAPVARLKALAAGSVDDEEKSALERIMRRRSKAARDLASGAESLAGLAQFPSGAPVEALLDDLSRVNRAASHAYSAYREALLFRVFPGGAGTYDRVLEQVLASDHRYVERGVSLVDTDWEPVE